MADNMGGIVSAEFCDTDSIAYCGVTSRGMLLGFKVSNPWRPFKSGMGKISLQAVPETTSGVTLYRISGEIQCARYLFGSKEEMLLLNQRRGLIRITLANGEILVAGDLDNPLTVIAEILTPSSASGFSGVKYTLTGTLTHPEIPLL